MKTTMLMRWHVVVHDRNAKKIALAYRIRDCGCEFTPVAFFITHKISSFPPGLPAINVGKIRESFLQRGDGHGMNIFAR